MNHLPRTRSSLAVIVWAALCGCSDTVNTMLGADDVFYYDDDPCLSGSSLSIESCDPSPPFSGSCDDGTSCPHRGGMQKTTVVHHWCADSIGNVNWPPGVDGSLSSNWGQGCDRNVLGVAFDSELEDSSLWEIKAADYTNALGFTLSFIADKIWTDVTDSVQKEEPRARQCHRDYYLGIADQKLFEKADSYFQPPQQVTVRHLPECEAYLHAQETTHTRPQFPSEASPMSANLFLYKLRADVPKPATVAEFGNTIGPNQLEVLTPATITADFRRLLPDFNWNGHAPKTHYEHGDVELDLAYDNHGLTFEGSAAAWNLIRQLVRASPWVAISPDTLTYFE